MSKKHIHKYHHVDTIQGKLWACALPGCNHHMPIHYENLLIGKFSICWACNEKLILDEEVMKSDKPECINCRTGLKEEKEKDISHLAEFLKDRGIN